MAKAKLSESEIVEAYVSELDLLAQKFVIYLIQFMKGISPSISEQVKWNSISFYYTGEMEDFDPKTYKRDILVCNFHRGKILLVFPTGARLSDQLNGKNYPDGRKIITLNNLMELKAKERQLKEVIEQWLKLAV